MATVISYSSIRSNLVYLVKNLSVDLLRPVMMELKLTTQEEHDKLADCRLSQQEKAEKLLISILPRKGKLGVEVFVKCLVWSGQLEAARKISVPQNVIERYLSECPHEKPHDFGVPSNCPQVGGPVFVLYASEYEGDRCEGVNRFVRYLSCLDVECVCDLNEPGAVHIQDWSAWVAEKMRLCCESHGHVLVVSSVTLARSLQSGVSQDVHMRRGKFNSLAIANLLAQDGIIRRSIPVFLHSSKTPDCIPVCLQGKTSFAVNIHKFHTELAGITSTEKVRQLAQLPCFRDMYDLGTYLVGSPGVKSMAATSSPSTARGDYLTDGELRSVAEGIGRDWRVLAEKLSVNEIILRSVMREYPNHDVEQGYRMLLAWRDEREGTLGKRPLGSLRHELRGSLHRSNWDELAEQL